MISLRLASASPSPSRFGLAGALAVAACAAFLVTGCSVDSRGFGGPDGGLGGGAASTGGSASSGGAPGIGGVPGSGGTVGTGGAHASGGTTGSAGKSGTGGKSASGGATASGGITGSGGLTGSGGNGGGAPGTGGVTGSGGGGPGGHPGAGGGGHQGSGSGGMSMGTGGEGGSSGAGGAGGMPGGGGQGGGAGKTCQQLVNEYAKALQEARMCTPGATDQCLETAPATLSYCNVCPQVPVNDATQVTAIRSQWLAQGCATPTVCPAIACIGPGGRICAVSNSGPSSGGLCQSSGIVAN